MGAREAPDDRFDDRLRGVQTPGFRISMIG